MYQCLVYQLNNAAAESMFSDTRIFSNINRLVNLIGYNPRGCTPSSFQAVVYKTDETDGGTLRGRTIPQFSALDTGKSDGNGRKIYFSTYETKTFDSDEQGSIGLYNGMWHLYPTIFAASGI